MKTEKSRTGITLLCALIAVVLLLSVTILFAFGQAEATTYAYDDAKPIENVLETGNSFELVLNTAEYNYVDFTGIISTDYIFTVTNAEGDIFARVIGISDEIETTEICNSVFSVYLEKDKTYKIGFISTKAETINICIRTRTNAFEWKINDEFITDKAFSLVRGKEYSVDLFINGQDRQSELSAIDGSIYDYSFDGEILNINDNCAVAGSGIVVSAKFYDDNGISISLIPEFDGILETKGVYLDKGERGFYFQYQSCITEIRYKVETASKTETYTVNSINGEALASLNPGQVYELEIDNAESSSGIREDAEISIVGATLKTAEDTASTYAVSTNALSVAASSVIWVGAGTSLDPYQVSSVAHFNDISGKDGSGVYFKQTVSLNFNNTATTRNVTFDGIYDGNTKNITNILISSGTSLYDGGLFDSNTGTIQSISYLSVQMGVLSGSVLVPYTYWGYAGGMVGKNTGIILTPSSLYINMKINCRSSSMVCILGGVAGCHWDGSITMNGNVNVNITSNGSIGGIVGQNTSNLFTNNYLNYKVKGKIYYTYFTDYADDVGGIAGINDGGMIQGYSSTITIKATANSTSSSIKPRIGGLIGKNSNGTIIAYIYTSYYSSYSNLTSSQKTYVDFTIDYIGEEL